MLSGEYLVLDGATSLVLPVIYGQTMEVSTLESGDSGLIEWHALQEKEEWFSAKIRIPDFSLIHSSDSIITKKLIELLKVLHSLNPYIFSKKNSYLIRTDLEFNRSWGLGSSSTLMANLAAWAAIDPMELFRSAATGSGYDIAATKRESPFLFKTVGKVFETEAVSIPDEITSCLYFAYSGQKQNSDSEVNAYMNRKPSQRGQIERISEISNGLATIGDLALFEKLVKEHETILSNLLNRPPVKELLFPDYTGTIKSLGAWGGDFLLFVHQGGREDLEAYLIGKGLRTVFSYNELIFN